MSPSRSYLNSLLGLTVVALLQTAVALAAVPRLVRDINTNPIGVSSNPQFLGTLGGNSYLAATDGTHGVELWRSDGTTAGTVMVQDLEPGSASSSPSGFVTVGTLGYFAATTQAAGNELWVTDGTASGTHQVADLAPGSLSSSPVVVGALGSRALVIASNGSTGLYLWITDGTASGTASLAPIYTQFPSPNALAVASNGKAYFSGPDGRVWVTDGTPGGTHVLPAPASGALAYSGSYVQMGNYLYFVAAPAMTPAELYRVSLADDSIEQVSSNLEVENYGSNGEQELVSIGNAVVFVAKSAGVEQVWRSDGTAAGTFALMGFNSQLGNSYLQPHFRVAGGHALFQTNIGTYNPQVFSTDGTIAGTVALPSILATSLNTVVSTGPYVYFVDPPLVYQTDGTVAGTVQLNVPGGGSPGYTGSAPKFAGDTTAVYFQAGTYPGTELIRYSPATAVLTVLKTTSTPMGDLFALSAGKLLFGVNDPTTGTEPWVSDGTVQGTRLLADIAPEPTQSGSSPSDFVAYRNQLYFAADDGVNGRELWRSDGTPAGTQLVADLAPGSAASSPTTLFDAGDSLMFFANSLALQGSRNLWSYNPDVGAPQPIVYATPAYPTCDPSHALSSAPLLAQLQGITYFQANGTADAIWRSDGTPDGTTQVTGFTHNTGWPCQMVAFGGRIYFMATAFAGDALWATDGTDAHTELIATAIPLAYNSSALLANAAGALYFFGQDAQGGKDLYRSDGTAAGTAVAAPLPAQLTFLGVAGNKLLFQSFAASPIGTQLAVFDPASSAFTSLPVVVSAPGPVTADGKLLFFTGYDTTHGAGPWVTDGTAAGTKALADSQCTAVTCVIWLGDFHNVAVYAALDSQKQFWIWRSDGTPEGTKALAPLAATQSLGIGTPIAVAAGNNFFFAMGDSVIGNELYALENEAPVAGDDSGTVVAGVPLTLDVVANDSDPDGHIDPATVTIVTAAGHGTASVSPDGKVVYTAAVDFTGTDSFTYSVADNQGRQITTPATVSVQVTAPPAPPAGTGGGSTTGGGSSTSGSSGGGGGSLDLTVLCVLIVLSGWRVYCRTSMRRTIAARSTAFETGLWRSR